MYCLFKNFNGNAFFKQLCPPCHGTIFINIDWCENWLEQGGTMLPLCSHVGMEIRLHKFCAMGATY